MLQISRCCNNEYPEIVGDAQDGHISLDPETDTDSGVKMATHDIAVCVVKGDFKADGGIFRQKGPHKSTHATS